MANIPSIGSITFSDMKRVFGGRSGTSNIFMGDYLPNGQFATETNYNAIEEIDSNKRMSMLRDKGRMVMGNASILDVTNTSTTIQWSGSNYSYAQVTWPNGSSNIPYGIFNFKIPGLSPTSNINITVKPITASGKIVNTIASPVLSIYILPTPISTIVVSNITDKGATVTWSGGIYNKIKVSWSGGSSPFILTGTSSYVVTGLTATTSYVFTVTPYNSMDIAGAPVSSSVITTIAATPVSTILNAYPPVGLTSSTTTLVGNTHGNGTYVVTCISQVTGREAYRAFDSYAFSYGYGWQATDGGVGNWMQIKLPNAIQLNKFEFNWMEFTLYNRMPSAFDLHGRQPGQTTFELLISVTKAQGGVVQYDIGSPKNSVFYDTFKLITTIGGSYCVVWECRLLSFTLV